MTLYSIWSYITNGAFKCAFIVQEAISPYLVSHHTETGKAALQKTSHHTPHLEHAQEQENRPHLTASAIIVIS